MEDEDNNKIISNSIILEVYEELRAFPENIIISPGCKTSINVYGGPNENSLSDFEVINKD